MGASAVPRAGNLATRDEASFERQRSVLARLLGLVEGRGADRIAERLLVEFGSIPRLLAQSDEAIERAAGGQLASARIVMAARDMMQVSLRAHLDPVVIDPFSPALRQYLIASMGSLPDERLRILFLDPARRLIADEQLQHGTLAELAIYPRTVFRRALEHNAAAIILVHNHPSGEPKPSAADVAATQKLEQVGRALDVQLLDHIIVTAAHTHHIMCSDVIAARWSAGSTCNLKDSASPGGDAAEAQIVENARTTMRRRILRRQLLGAPDLFGEPAWDMMLDLFIHQSVGELVPMSSLGVVADMPHSSALKLIQRLCNAGLLVRVPDARDGRRNFVKIDPDVAHRLRAYFAEGAE
jgi:DNA repair protein RadC